MTSGDIWARAGLAAIALMLAACSETLGGFNTHVAEVDAEPGAQASNAGNIASLSEVIQRNPSDAAAYNTRGVVYAKLGKYSNAIEDFSHTIELIPISPALTRTGRLPIVKPRRTISRSRTSIRRSRSIRMTRPLI